MHGPYGFPVGDSLAPGLLGLPLGRLPGLHVKEPPVDGAVLWLDASDTSTFFIVSSEVQQWNDKSGNGWHASVPPGSRPDYGTRTWPGNRDVLVPDFGGGDYLETTLVLAAQSYTWFAVGDPDDPGNGGAGARTILATVGTENLINLNLGYYHYAVSAFVAPNGIVPEAGRPFVFGVSWDGAFAGFAVGNHDETVAQTGSTPSGDLIVGARGGPSQFYDGSLAEILVYNSVLDRNQMDEVASYLINKWGFTA